MAYGLKYQTQFTSRSDSINGVINNPERDYTLQFLFKDYSGEVATLTGAATAVIQKCTVQEHNAPIKGQSLDIRLINKGNIPISSFQSDDDDGVMVKLIDNTGVTRFIGFLVQDDFYEGMVDFGHEITLSANDSLGLLKGVILSDANVRRSFYAVRRTNGVDTVVYCYVASTAFYPTSGDTIEFLGSTYTIATAVNEDTVISGIGYNWTITLTTSTGGIAYGDETIYLTGNINLLQRNSLLSMIAVCLGPTNLSLVLNIFHNLYESEQDATISTFDQTLIDSQTFITGETYLDCYEVLSRILATFRCTLFQANGCWNIVAWDEARKYGNAIPAFVYDETFAPIGTDTFTNIFNIGPEPELTRPIYELVQGGVRGYKFARKVFNYEPPKYLLKNYDLQQVGALRSTYESGGIRYTEYEAPYWQGTYGSPSVDRFIRVEYDLSLQRESDRYLVIRGDTFDISRSLPGDPIESNIYDQVSFACRFRTNISQNFGGFAFSVRLMDGTLDRYLRNDHTWSAGPGISYVLPSGENYNTWHEIESGYSNPLPFSGLVIVYLPSITGVNPPPGIGKETHFKDIRFGYQTYVNDSLKVIGHIHKQEQSVNKKANSDSEIPIDDSPRNAIKGTLFLSTKTGLLQNRTQFWRYPYDGNGWRLGEITTLDELTWRQKTRAKFDGGYIGLWQNGVPVSLLTLVQMSFTPTKNYTFGLLTIDYKSNQFSGELWELYDENDGIFDPDYEFKYIYSTT